jgi:hypothetical protein
MAQNRQVCPTNTKLTDGDARHLLAAGIIRACHPHGPSRVGLEIGCNEKTVRRARDQEGTLGLACVVNLLDVDETALDELFAAKGYKLVSTAVAAGVDAIVAQSATIYKLGRARDPNGPGGVAETDAELIDMEGEVEAALLALSALQSRIIAAKLRRAA